MSYIVPGYPHLTYRQLENLWVQAGGPRKVAPLMAAIAMAESAGWAGNTNPTDNTGGTQTSWGLWQISNGTHSSPAPAGKDPYDPLTNARLAVSKYHGQGLTAWGTYTSGLYRKYLDGHGGGYVPPLGSADAGGTAGGGGDGSAVLASDTSSSSSSSDSSTHPAPGITTCYLKFPKVSFKIGHVGGWCMDWAVFGVLTLVGGVGILAGAALMAVGVGSQSAAAGAIVSRTRSVTKL